MTAGTDLQILAASVAVSSRGRTPQRTSYFLPSTAPRLARSLWDSTVREVRIRRALTHRCTDKCSGRSVELVLVPGVVLLAIGVCDMRLSYTVRSIHFIVPYLKLSAEQAWKLNRYQEKIGKSCRCPSCVAFWTAPADHAI